MTLLGQVINVSDGRFQSSHTHINKRAVMGREACMHWVLTVTLALASVVQSCLRYCCNDPLGTCC